MSEEWTYYYVATRGVIEENVYNSNNGQTELESFLRDRINTGSILAVLDYFPTSERRILPLAPNKDI